MEGEREREREKEEESDRASRTETVDREGERVREGGRVGGREGRREVNSRRGRGADGEGGVGRGELWIGERDKGAGWGLCSLECVCARSRTFAC